MKVNINSVHFKSSDRLEAFINEKIEKLNTFYDGVIGSDVTLKIDNTGEEDNKIAEVRLMIKGNDLYAKKTCKSFEESIDTAVEALRRQLVRYKERLVK